MKKIFFLTSISFLLLMTNACNKLEDIEPTYRVSEDKAIVDAATAENVLSGVYSKIRSTSFVAGVQAHSLMGLSDGSQFNPADDLLLNAPRINHDRVEGLYRESYGIIQEANLFMERLDLLPAQSLGGEDVKNNFLAEARFLRGLAHFYLLRAYGQFYNSASEYGISLRLSSATDDQPIARSSVAESYAAIHEDLDFAIANCTATEAFRASKEAAQSIKAKVLLYERKYAEAAALSKQVIDNTTKTFAPIYKDIFGGYNEATETFIYAHESPELIFGPYGTESTERFFGVWGRPQLSIYASIAMPDPNDVTTWDVRAVGAPAFWPPGAFDPLTKGSLFFRLPSGFVFSPNTQPHMRLSGLYLLHAEAAARVGTGVDVNALASLNAVRTREAVGLPALVEGTDINSKAELLEAIRKESLMELFLETGEEFFMLVRYEQEGDLTPSDIKPTMNNKDFYIFPIPWIELQIEGATDVIKQNPGYPTSL